MWTRYAAREIVNNYSLCFYPFNSRLNLGEGCFLFVFVLNDLSLHKNGEAAVRTDIIGVRDSGDTTTGDERFFYVKLPNLHPIVGMKKAGAVCCLNGSGYSYFKRHVIDQPISSALSRILFR